MSHPLHVIINETQSNFVLIKSFPCAECARLTRTKEKANRIHQKPVFHGIQYGKCPGCLAEHFVINGRNKADCIALEPVLKDFQYSIANRSG